MDPKNELLRHLIYPAPKRTKDQLTSQLSFEFFETAKYFRRTSRKLVKRLSQPSLKEMKKLKPESLEKLKKFSIILQKRRRAGPSPSGSFDSVISLDGLFGGDDPLLLVCFREGSQFLGRVLNFKTDPESCFTILKCFNCPIYFHSF